MRVISSRTYCSCDDQASICDRASTWTAGAAMRSPMVDDNPFRGKQYLISSCDSLPEPSFVPQIKNTENGLRHRRTKVMRAALSALAARTSPNFGLILGGRRHGYSGCGLAAGELGVGHCGGISGGCSGRHQNGRFLLLFS